MSLLDLNEPTDTDCDEHETNRVAIIVAGSVVGGVLLLIAVIITVYFSYKCFKICQRTYRRLKMPAEERRRLEEQNREFLELLRDPYLTGDNRKDVIDMAKKLIHSNQGLLKGDGPGDDAANNADEEKRVN